MLHSDLVSPITMYCHWTHQVRYPSLRYSASKVPTWGSRTPFSPGKEMPSISHITHNNPLQKPHIGQGFPIFASLISFSTLSTPVDIRISDSQLFPVFKEAACCLSRRLLYLRLAQVQLRNSLTSWLIFPWSYQLRRDNAVTERFSIWRLYPVKHLVSPKWMIRTRRFALLLMGCCWEWQYTCNDQWCSSSGHWGFVFKILPSWGYRRAKILGQRFPGALWDDVVE